MRVKLQRHVRWMNRRDLPEVLDIEAASFGNPWGVEDFLRCLRQRNHIGMVAEQDDRIVGFMVYRLSKTRLHVLNFAVAPDCRRRGIGTTMVDKLKGKLRAQYWHKIIVDVRESNVAAQLFFRENGFRAVAVLRGYYDDSDEDAYRMRFGIPRRRASSEAKT